MTGKPCSCPGLEHEPTCEIVNTDGEVYRRAAEYWKDRYNEQRRRAERLHRAIAEICVISSEAGLL